MMTGLSEKRLMREKEKIDQSPNDQFIAFPSPNNIFEWHFLLFNINDSPFDGGQYHGKILIPPEYPLKPPAILFVTPNGRFKCGEKICLSFTNYHPETWSTSWTIQSMLIGLISFMHTKENTLGGMKSSDQQKQIMARQSIQFNNNNQVYMEMFKDHKDLINKLNSQIQTQLSIQQSKSETESIIQSVNHENVENYQVFVNNEQENANQNRRNRNQKFLISLSIFLVFLVILFVINDF